MWHQAPFVRFLFPLLAGIIIAAFSPHKISPLFLTGTVLLFAAINFFPVFHTKYFFRWIYGAVLNLLFFISGYQVTINNTEKLHSSHYSKFEKETIVAEIAEPLVAKKKSYKTILQVKEIHNGETKQPASGKIIAYFQKDSLAKKLKYGNIIVFSAGLNEIPPPQNPSEFNYKRFLYFHNIYEQTYLKTTDWKLLNNEPAATAIGYAYRIRDYLMSIFKKYEIAGNEYAVASALMLGAREDIDKDLVQAYASSGALHVLSVSGLHVGVVFIILNYVLVFFDKIKNGLVIKTLLQLFGLWFYAVLTGLSPSVIRAATMFSFLTIGKARKSNTNIYNILAASAFFLLALNPFLIMEVGFQLSYIAVLGIVFIQPKLNLLWDAHIPVLGKAGNWLLRQIWAIITVSIAAQIATFPLGLLYFHQFPNYFLFSNLVVIPVSSLIIYTGIILFAASPFEIIAKYIALIFKWSIWLLNKSVVVVEQLPYSLFNGISITVFETWLIYILIFLMLIFFFEQNIRFLKFSFFILIALLIYRLYENDVQQKQKKFIVYNIKNTSAYDFVNGKENFFFSDSSFINDESKILFHVRHNWWELGTDNNFIYDIDKNNEIKSANVFAKNNFIQFGDKKFALVNQYFKKPKCKIEVDYVLLSGSPKISVSELQKFFSFKKLIIDSSNSFYAEKKWKSEAKDLGINFHSVISQGACIEEL